jgi:hypothetical protein
MTARTLPLGKPIASSGSVSCKRFKTIVRVQTTSISTTAAATKTTERAASGPAFSSELSTNRRSTAAPSTTIVMMPDMASALRADHLGSSVLPADRLPKGEPRHLPSCL